MNDSSNLILVSGYSIFIHLSVFVLDGFVVMVTLTFDTQWCALLTFDYMAFIKSVMTNAGHSRKKIP